METQHFKNAELQCRCGCGRNEMDEDFMRRLEELRVEVDFPMVLTSAYRCPDHNAKVSATETVGPHTQGKAVDVKIAGEQAFQLVKSALALGFHGIGINQNGDWERRYIHLDIADIPGNRPRIWTY